MDFRVMVLSLFLWLFPFGASAIDQLDELTELVYQYPSKAFSQLALLEKTFAASHINSDINQLRLSMLKCQNLLQLGENEAAINVAQLGDARAKQLKLDQARPYFLICQADANLSNNNIQNALPLLDSAITLARRYQQPQALVDALRLRGQLDTDTDNFSSAIEDLRLAIDIYPDIHTQTQNWVWPPQAYIYAAMGNLLYATHDFPQAMYYTNLGIQSSDAKGKVLQIILLNAARIALDNQEFDYSNQLEIRAKTLLPELGTQLELAYSYAILASIALDKGRIDNADEYISIAISIFKKQNQKVAIMRSNRLLAQIRFAQHQDDEALILMNQAIEQGESLNQYSDLKGFYGIMSDYYLEQDDFKQAYAFLLKRYRATELANQEMNNARILQFKARLNQQNIGLTGNDHAPESDSILQELNVDWVYSTLFLIAMLLLGGMIWYLIDKQNKRAPHIEGDEPVETLVQQILSVLNNAKQGNYPLSLLIFNASQIRQVDLPSLQDELQHRLREQDKLIRYSMDEIVIVLPHTSTEGAQKVITQLVACIQPWQGSSKVNIGVAAMQQFDTLESLIKRASINQLGKVKSGENN
ncbi:diguanylate cyclase [Shewanella glacialipiscicola]|uniref:tetratricopeptide repeat-containing diguanylate cyclase n=1 Tax=Shewanella glacialipiscicola TaxID=614069 RepID=UPI0021DB700F|nr:diguanylate cyclase [Shewanella glacialipiscicola]MCU7994478.1 diguanylate cyclase [Shewanella glacialipiscicola]MCU8025949.1 diguanylate cyclase [Shewanella glacialipiscicola]